MEEGEYVALSRLHLTQKVSDALDDLSIDLVDFGDLLAGIEPETLDDGIDASLTFARLQEIMSYESNEFFGTSLDLVETIVEQGYDVTDAQFQHLEGIILSLEQLERKTAMRWGQISTVRQSFKTIYNRYEASSVIESIAKNYAVYAVFQQVQDLRKDLLEWKELLVRESFLR